MKGFEDYFAMDQMLRLKKTHTILRQKSWSISHTMFCYHIYNDSHMKANNARTPKYLHKSQHHFFHNCFTIVCI